MAITAQTLIAGAYELVGIKDPFEPVSAPDAQMALRRLNQMLANWRTQRLTKAFVSRNTFSLVANQGGPSNPYTIGPGGDFDMVRPQSLDHAGLLLNAASPATELPRAILTEQAYQLIHVKELTSTLFTAVYYEATYSGGLGTINLWPVPDNADNSLILYVAEPIAAFADLTTSYDVPPGYEDALEYNLAVRLCAPFNRPVPNDVLAMARSTLADVKRINTAMTDLDNDALITTDERWGYNIETGTGS